MISDDLSERERLEQRAQELDVTVKSLWDCEHPSSLIYFDTVYGAQCSWEICDVCGTKHSVTELKAPDEVVNEHFYTDQMPGYYDAAGYHPDNSSGEEA